MRFKEVQGCFCMKKARKHSHYYIDGKEVSKKKYRALSPCAGRNSLTIKKPPATVAMSSEVWPRKSDNLGVSKHQIKEAREIYAKNGVPTDFDEKTGQAIIRDNQHQRDLLKMRGEVNYDGGYGQVTG